jgi:hypothetical protein
MQTDYPELRAWLAQQESFEQNMKKSPWTCTIKDKEALTAVEMLTWNAKIQPSSIVIKKEDGSFVEFWYEVYIDQQNIPYDIRLPMYPQYYIVY